jgi:hypothetical protein
MSASAPQVRRSRRPSTRESAIRIARYSVFPRTASEHSRRSGFMRDDSGLRLVTTTPQQPGELLRINIQSLSGRTRDTLARVLSCEASGDEGRFEVALEALDTRRTRFVRPGTNV